MTPLAARWKPSAEHADHPGRPTPTYVNLASYFASAPLKCRYFTSNVAIWGKIFPKGKNDFDKPL
jgi:hypothetical protein